MQQAIMSSLLLGCTVL